MWNILWNVVFILIFLGQSVHSLDDDESKSIDIISQIDVVVAELMTLLQIPGASVSVVTNGTVFKSLGYGYRNMEKKQEVTENTLFSMGSLTKSFTASLALKYFTQMNFSMDEPLINILGNNNLIFSDRYRSEQMTMKDLLSHRTGLEPNPLIILTDSVPNRDNFVRRIRYFPQLAAFRDKFIYDNDMYLLAGWILEQITGKTWEDLVKEEFFQKFMTNTMLAEEFADEFDKVDGATSYYSNGSEFMPFDMQFIRRVNPYNPAGGIVSNAKDMANYMNYHLQNPSLQLNTSITAIGVRQSITPKYTCSLGGYGYGFVIADFNGESLVTHGGSCMGEVSNLALFPELNFGMLSVNNGPSAVKSSVFNQMVMTYTFALLTEGWYNGDIVNDTLAYLQKSEDAVKMMESEITYVDVSNLTSNVMDNTSLNSFTGIYGNLSYGNVTINSSDSSLDATIGWLSGSLLATNKTGVFQIQIDSDTIIQEMDNAPMYVVFNQLPYGKVKYTDMYTMNLYFRFERDLNLLDGPEKLWNDTSC